MITSAKIVDMANSLDRNVNDIRKIRTLLNALIYESEIMNAIGDYGDTLNYIFEECDWLLGRREITLDEYIVMRHVAYQELKEG